MPQEYSNPARRSDAHSLPDIEIFELTASEVAEMDEDTIHEYMRRPEFKLAAMNSQVRARMIDAIVYEQELTGGWFWWSCFPGCMPDSEPMGPFKTYGEARDDAQEGAE